MLHAPLILFAIAALFTSFSMLYIYKYRGVLRYQSFTEYIRKGWPIFAPINCFFYLMTKQHAQKAILDINDFKELQPLMDNWKIIRQEVRELWQSKAFDQTKDPDNPSYYDVGFRTFYKYGWGKFYLNWYGYTHQSALNQCPNTVALLKQIKSINGAMFSVLPAGSKLTRHLDPLACSLRFHLALDTPESDDCFISVDGQSYSWRNGEAFLFDETYLHHANNNSNDYRLILMCDVERPMNGVGKLVNSMFRKLMWLTVVPNTAEDKRGVANTVFSTIAPFLKHTKELKKKNPKSYKIVKWVFNISLLIIASAIVIGMISFVTWLLNLL